MRSRWVELVRDGAAPLALTALTLLNLYTNPAEFAEPHALAMALLVPMALLLAARRHRPGVVAIGTTALAVLYIVGVQQDLARQPPLTPFLATLLAFFALGAFATQRELAVAGPIAGGLLLAEEVGALTAGRHPGDVVPALALWTAALTVGRLLHYRRAEAKSAEARAELAEDERDERARLAVAMERTRIARELHDVVAHNLSVIVIQAAAEARSAAGDSRETLRTIERTGRETLTELRDLLGLLRTTDDATALMAPPPSLGQLDVLVSQLRVAGLRVDVEVEGVPVALPAGLDLSAYRIAQEALTNALKHAPGAGVRLRLTYRADAVVVEVTDDGRARGVPTPRVGGSGHGMVGMRERVLLYGGRFAAGPDGDGGFAVRAELPLARETV
jgi:signal transduction histidine kinase